MSEYLDTRRTTTSHETPIKCPYGCGKDIAKTKVVIKLPHISGELVPYLNLQMYYEMTEHNDLGHIHICKRFQKVIDIDARVSDDAPPGQENIDQLKDFGEAEAKDFIRSEIDLIYDQVENESEIDELYNDYMKIDLLSNEIDRNDLLSDKKTLEEKLINSIQAIKCHNVYTSIVELANLYNSRGLFNVAIQIFNIVLQWNEYEPISILGKAEASLISGSDEKSVALILNNCAEYLHRKHSGFRNVIKKSLKPEHPDFWEVEDVYLLFGFVDYDLAFVKSKMNYLRAIVDLRWNRKNEATERIKESIEYLEENFINIFFNEDEIADGKINNKVFLSKVVEGEEMLTGKPVNENIRKEIENDKLVTPHFDLLYHALDLYVKLAKYHPDGKIVRDAMEKWEKYSQIRSGNYKIKELGRENLEKEIEIFEKQNPKEILDEIVGKDAELNLLHRNVMEEEMSRILIEQKEEEMRENLNYEEITDMANTEEFMPESEDIDDGSTVPLDIQSNTGDNDFGERWLSEYSNIVERNKSGQIHVAKNCTWNHAKFYLLEMELSRALEKFTQIKNTRNRLVHQIPSDEPLKKYQYPILDQEQKKNMDELKESIKELGQQQPIILDENENIIDGNKRMQVCEELGIEPKTITINSKKIGGNFSTPEIPTTVISDQDMIGEIEIAFRKLIKRKLSKLDNWENENIPKEVLEKAKHRLEEAKLGPYGVSGNSWLEYLEVKDFERIFCNHCKTCSKKTFRDKKTGKILSGRHSPFECKKSNWDLYFRKVFGGNFKIFQGDLAVFREIRNSLSHHSGTNVGEYLTQDGKDELKRVYTKWNKFLCKDQDVSNLV